MFGAAEGGRGRVRSLLGGGLVALCALSGCAGTAQRPAELPATVPATGGGPEELLCYAGPTLVYLTADGRVTRPLSPPPPEDLYGLAAAGPLLVGAGQGTVYTLRLDRPEARWDLLARFGPPDFASTPARVAGYRDQALVWLRGRYPGIVPAALVVSAQGTQEARVSRYPVEAAERSIGRIWQSTGVPEGPSPLDFPPALRLMIAEVRLSGEDAKERLVHSERSWWGGRLVAPDLGGAGEWPIAPLLLLRDEERRAPVPLLYNDQPLMARGLIGYAGDQSLYLDGRFASRAPGVLRVRPPQRQRSRDRLVAEPLIGLRGPCAILPASAG